MTKRNHAKQLDSSRVTKGEMHVRKTIPVIAFTTTHWNFTDENGMISEVPGSSSSDNQLIVRLGKGCVRWEIV